MTQGAAERSRKADIAAEQEKGVHQKQPAKGFHEQTYQPVLEPALKPCFGQLRRQLHRLLETRGTARRVDSGIPSGRSRGLRLLPNDGQRDYFGATASIGRALRHVRGVAGAVGDRLRTRVQLVLLVGGAFERW